MLEQSLSAPQSPWNDNYPAIQQQWAIIATRDHDGADDTVIMPLASQPEWLSLHDPKA